MRKERKMEKQNKKKEEKKQCEKNCIEENILMVMMKMYRQNHLYMQCTVLLVFVMFSTFSFISF